MKRQFCQLHITHQVYVLCLTVAFLVKLERQSLSCLEKSVQKDIFKSHSGDRLTAIHNRLNGVSRHFVHDALGNPTRHDNWNMSWTRGRLLQSIVSRGLDTSWRFYYDENGIRYRKVEFVPSAEVLGGITFNTTDFFCRRHSYYSRA